MEFVDAKGSVVSQDGLCLRSSIIGIQNSMMRTFSS